MDVTQEAGETAGCPDGVIELRSGARGQWTPEERLGAERLGSDPVPTFSEPFHVQRSLERDS